MGKIIFPMQSNDCTNNLDQNWYSYKYHREDNSVYIDSPLTVQTGNIYKFIYSMPPIKDDIQSSFEE